MTIVARYARNGTPPAPANFKNTKGSRITSGFGLRVEVCDAKFKKRYGLAYHLNQRLELHVGFGFDILTVAALLLGVLGLLGIVSHRAPRTLMPASAADKSLSAHAPHRAPAAAQEQGRGRPPTPFIPQRRPHEHVLCHARVHARTHGGDAAASGERGAHGAQRAMQMFMGPHATPRARALRRACRTRRIPLVDTEEARETRDLVQRKLNSALSAFATFRLATIYLPQLLLLKWGVVKYSV